jgi:hypothetical protein
VEGGSQFSLVVTSVMAMQMASTIIDVAKNYQ